MDLTRRLEFRHWVAIDVIAAVAAIALIGGRMLSGSVPGAMTAQGQTSVVLACVAAIAVAARRAWPIAALAVAVAAQVTATLTAGLPGATATVPTLLAMALVIYMAARVKPAVPARMALLSVLAATALAAFLAPGAYSVPVSVGFGSAPIGLVRAMTAGVPAAAAWATGRAMRSSASYQERYARATVQEERLRIARELHDVVAHSMSVIAVQAGVGHFVIRNEPEEAEKALAVIETTSRAALAEMRRLLDMLREERPGDLLPAPGLAGLPELVGQTRRAGLDVELAVAGEARELPAGEDLAAFRVIQEALTNVLKHSGSSRCRVSLGYQADGVTITVTDDGPGSGKSRVPGESREPGHGETGHGLAGMRERVTMYGGTFRAGPRTRPGISPGTGFEVEARLPL